MSARSRAEESTHALEDAHAHLRAITAAHNQERIRLDSLTKDADAFRANYGDDTPENWAEAFGLVFLVVAGIGVVIVDQILASPGIEIIAGAGTSLFPGAKAAARLMVPVLIFMAEVMLAWLVAL